MSQRKSREKSRRKSASKDIKLIKLIRAQPPKKWMAVFEKNGKVYHRWFGAHGYEDYTMHKDKNRRESYRKRHAKDLGTKDPMRAGYLSFFVLWNKPTIKTSLADYRRRLRTYNQTGTFPVQVRGGGRNSRERSVPEFSGKYVPTTLSKSDRRKQKRELRRARRGYKEGIYVARPRVKSYPKKTSPHILKAKKMYGVDRVVPTDRKLAKESGCSTRSMRRIVRKGRGAYYSSGSRPNQSSDSWAYARLASSLTGGKASCVDRHILEIGCDKKKTAYALMKKTCGSKKKRRSKKKKSGRTYGKRK